MPEQLTKREQIAAMLAAAMSGAWISVPSDEFEESFSSVDEMLAEVNELSAEYADDLLRRLKETEAKNNA